MECNACAACGVLTVNCRLSTVNFSEDVLQAKLNLSRWLITEGIGRLHRAQRRRPEGPAGNIKMRNIEQVKELSPEFEPAALVPERDAFEQ